MQSRSTHTPAHYFAAYICVLVLTTYICVLILKGTCRHAQCTHLTYADVC